MSFRIFQKEETPFQTVKTRSSQSRKIEIFPKGLVHGFSEKLVIFRDFFFFGKIGKKNVFYHILEGRNAFLDYKNKKLKKSKNWDSFKGVSAWFWSKIGNFFRFCFLEKISEKNVFYEILERRNAFLDYKNKKFKKSKNWDFSKGLVHGFGQKLVIFLDLLFQGK